MIESQLYLIKLVFLQQVNGHADPLSDLTVSGATMKSDNTTPHNSRGDNTKLGPKRGPIIDMRAMISNAIKGATQEYVGQDQQDPSVSIHHCISLLGRGTWYVYGSIPIKMHLSSRACSLFGEVEIPQWMLECHLHFALFRYMAYQITSLLHS